MRAGGRMLTATILALVCGAGATHHGSFMLRAQLAQGVVQEGSGISAAREESWATSWLEAAGGPGTRAGSAPTTYGPFRLSDGDPRTAWCEGVAGDGVGEVVIGPGVQLG